MQTSVSELIIEGEKFPGLIKNKFGALTTEQLNWKPVANKWSIAQCIKHLILTNSKYFDVFSRIADNNYKPGLWSKMGLFKSFWGKMLVKSVHPDTPRKVKTMSSVTPDSSNIDKSVLSEFDENMKTTLDYFRKLKDKDIEHITITSPLLSIVVYRLKVVFPLLIYHVQRHINQATRVMQTEGFPK